VIYESCLEKHITPIVGIFRSFSKKHQEWEPSYDSISGISRNIKKIDSKPSKNNSNSEEIFLSEKANSDKEWDEKLHNSTSSNCQKSVSEDGKKQVSSFMNSGIHSRYSICSIILKKERIIKNTSDYEKYRDSEKKRII
jgi:hypothetical protein